MYRTHLICTRLPFQKLQCFRAPTASSVSGKQEKFIDEGAPEKFQTISECQNDIADGGIRVEDQPRKTVLRIVEQAEKGLAGMI